jgi:hypothetical protein
MLWNLETYKTRVKTEVSGVLMPCNFVDGYQHSDETAA